MNPIIVIMVLLFSFFSVACATTIDLKSGYMKAVLFDGSFAQSTSDRLAIHSSLPKAWAGLLPQLSFDHIKQWNSLSSSGMQNRFSFNQPLIYPGVWNHVHRAHVAIQKADVIYAQAVQDLIFRVCCRYIDVWMSHARYQSMYAEWKWMQSLARSIADRHSVGLVSALDAGLIQTQCNDAWVAMEQQKNVWKNAYDAWTQLTGDSSSSMPDIRDFKIKPLRMIHIPWSEKEWVSKVRTCNLEIAESGLDAQIARLETEHSMMSMLPTLDASYMRQNMQMDRFFPQPKHIASLQIHVPIFEGGGSIAELNVKKYQQQGVWHRHRTVMQNHILEVKRCYRDYHLYQKLLKNDRFLLQSKRADMTALEASYRSGVSTLADFLKSKHALQEAQYQHLWHTAQSVLLALKLQMKIGTLTQSVFHDL